MSEHRHWWRHPEIPPLKMYHTFAFPAHDLHAGDEIHAAYDVDNNATFRCYNKRGRLLWVEHCIYDHAPIPSRTTYRPAEPDEERSMWPRISEETHERIERRFPDPLPPFIGGGGQFGGAGASASFAATTTSEPEPAEETDHATPPVDDPDESSSASESSDSSSTSSSDES